MREIIFYKTASGRKPVEDFIDTLSSKQVQKVAWVLNLVEELNNVPTRYFKKLENTDGIWEVRVIFGSNIFRFLGFFDGPSLVVLTHGFQKKSQKTPQNAIRVAEERKREYIKRRVKE